MNVNHAAQTRGLQAQTRLLLSQELYESAEVVGSLMLCASRSAPQDRLPPTGDGSHTESLALYADALKGKGEFKRALSYYRQAAQRRRVGMAAAAAAARRPAQSPYGHAVENAAEALLKFKEAQCNVELGETSSAINALEAIPVKWRTCAANLCLGRLLRNAGLKRNAINAYKEALRQNPLALEAVAPLVQLGVSSEDIMAIMQSAPGMAGLSLQLPTSAAASTGVATASATAAAVAAAAPGAGSAAAAPTAGARALPRRVCVVDCASASDAPA